MQFVLCERNPGTIFTEEKKKVLHKITWFIWERYDEDVIFNDSSAKIKCAMTLGGYHLRIRISQRQKKGSMKN